MSDEQILRIRRTDADGEFILLHVVPHPYKPLNIVLVASEGEHVYNIKLRESDVKSLQANNFSGDLGQWKAILRYALLRERPVNGISEALQGIETVCSIDHDSLTITIRKNIGGIHQRLGTINLPENDVEEIEPFHWAAISTAKVDELLQRTNEMQMAAMKHEAEMAKLTKQLDDLVQAKKDHESEILKKCAALLNAKKLKIRDQQRLLAGAKVNVNEAQQVSNARLFDGSTKGRKAISSRIGKRKASEHTATRSEEHDRADAEDEEEGEPDAELETDQETPDPTDDEADEDAAMDSVKAPPSSRTRATGKASSQAKPPSSDNALNGGRGGRTGDEASGLPPQRELPFTKKPGTSDSAQNKPNVRSQPTVAQDEETDDEEL